MLAATALLVLALGAGVWISAPRQPRVADASAPPAAPVAEGPYVPRPKQTLTFTKDVAPIVFENCSGCHRPEQTAPFSLLSYDQVKKRARQIVDLTASGLMPPWPPERGYGRFKDERRLSADQVGILRQWCEEGGVEGRPQDLPRLPAWPSGWRSGEPDLVVTMPMVYTLPAEGKDVYRNFVFPIPNSALRFVKGVEFRPGNARVVHHAFINVDETRQSRRLAQKQEPPGFDGMDLPDSAVMPAGQLLGWQPGKTGYRVSEGLSWLLRPNTDLVLQMHMQPTGKPETVQPSIGFYFSDQAPTNFPFRIRLLNFELNVPPGEANYVAESSYVLPVDVSLLRVNPHAHYLGKDLQGYALLPNGEKRWLLWIKNWNFNWQGDYQYAEPVALPKGAKLVMRYTYDNSTNNIRNPNQPPQWVRHGPNTTDEMAALGFQALAHNEEDRQALAKDSIEKLVKLSMSYDQFLLRLNPNDVMAHVKLARILASQGKLDQALNHLRTALQTKPDDDKAHYELGYIYILQNRLSQADVEFQTVIQLNPADAQAYGNLGLIALKEKRLEQAQSYLETALRLNPDDQVARRNLTLVRQTQLPH
jgi:tetratricopeptide (TPR) repeat protein